MELNFTYVETIRKGRALGISSEFIILHKDKRFTKRGKSRDPHFRDIDTVMEYVTWLQLLLYRNVSHRTKKNCLVCKRLCVIKLKENILTSFFLNV